ncbi:MAG: ATPase, T2SS/T4P/T4SS family [Patescibacteria group bacterium]
MESSQYLLVKGILIEAVTRGAVDLHFSVGNNPVLRVNGELVVLQDKDLITQDFMEKLMASLLTVEQRKKVEVDREIVLTHNFDKDLRFKINVFYQRGFLSATLRHIPAKIPTIGSLGLNSVIRELTKLKSGLVIISGPFGSGRTTTAIAMLEEINQTRKEYIITIEDPIEYLFANKESIVEQREVGRDTKSFLDALHYFQEEDGDILFLGEMGDSKTIPMVLEIARGSSLVLTVLGAASAVNTVASILDIFQSFDQERVKDLLATSLRAIICQKMVPKVGGGSLVVQEIMLVNDAVKSIILGGSNQQLDNIIQTSRKEGMISFDQALAQLVNERKILLKDAIDNASNRLALESLLREKY